MAEERDEDDGLSQRLQEDEEAPVPKTKKAKGKRTGVLTPSAANALHF